MAGSISILVGLPGSGKSRRFRALSQKATGICADDFMAEIVPRSPIPRSSHFNDSARYKKLISDLRRGRYCVISDIVFCDTLIRNEVKTILTDDVPALTINWEFFENSPRKCRANVIRRGRESRRRELALIRVLSQKYVVPIGAKTHAVWQPKKRKGRR